MDRHSDNTRNQKSANIYFNRLTETSNSHTLTSLWVYDHLLSLVQKYEQKLFLKK